MCNVRTAYRFHLGRFVDVRLEVPLGAHVQRAFERALAIDFRQEGAEFFRLRSEAPFLFGTAKRSLEKRIPRSSPFEVSLVRGSKLGPSVRIEAIVVRVLIVWVAILVKVWVVHIADVGPLVWVVTTVRVAKTVLALVGIVGLAVLIEVRVVHIGYVSVAIAIVRIAVPIAVVVIVVVLVAIVIREWLKGLENICY